MFCIPLRCFSTRYFPFFPLLTTLSSLSLPPSRLLLKLCVGQWSESDLVSRICVFHLAPHPHKSLKSIPLGCLPPLRPLVLLTRVVTVLFLWHHPIFFAVALPSAAFTWRITNLGVAESSISRRTCYSSCFMLPSIHISVWILGSCAVNIDKALFGLKGVCEGLNTHGEGRNWTRHKEAWIWLWWWQDRRRGIIIWDGRVCQRRLQEARFRGKASPCQDETRASVLERRGNTSVWGQGSVIHGRGVGERQKARTIMVILIWPQSGPLTFIPME